MADRGVPAGWIAANVVTLGLIYATHLSRLLEQLPGPTSSGVIVLFSWWTLAALAAFALLLHYAALAGRPIAWLLAPLALAVAYIDVRLYELMGVHLLSPIALDTLNNPGAGRELDLGTSTVTAIGLAAAMLPAVEALVYRGLRRPEIPSLFGRAASGRVVLGVVAVFLGSAGASIALKPAHPTGPDRLVLGGMPLGPLMFGGSAIPLDGVTLSPVPTVRATPKRTPDILFLVVESWRADTLTADLMPRTTAAALDLDCSRSAKHYAGGHTTEFGVFTLLYALDSWHYPVMARDQLPSPVLLRLSTLGYRSTGISASALRDWNDAAFMTLAFDTYEEHLEGEGWEGDRLVAAAAATISAGTTPHFLFGFLNATHHNYSYPPEYGRFAPVLPHDYNHFIGDDTLRQTARAIENRYLNAIGYVDATIGGILETVAHHVRAGELIVVVTGDHGEEFWEHGLLGHAASTFVDERMRVPLLMCGRGLKGLRFARSGHVDVWPTVLDALGAGGDASEWSNGISLLRGAPRLLVAGGRDFPFRGRTAMVVDSRRKHVLELCGGGGLCLVEVPDGPPLSAADLEAFTRRMRRFLSFGSAGK